MLHNLKPLTLSLLRSSVNKLICGLDKQTVKTVKTGQAQRVVLSGAESGRRPATSGAPHGTVLGPVLLSRFINEPDEGAECTSSKFADDTKMGEIADTLEGCAATQSSIKR